MPRAAPAPSAAGPCNRQRRRPTGQRRGWREGIVRRGRSRTGCRERGRRARSRARNRRVALQWGTHAAPRSSWNCPMEKSPSTPGGVSFAAQQAIYFRYCSSDPHHSGPQGIRWCGMGSKHRGDSAAREDGFGERRGPQVSSGSLSRTGPGKSRRRRSQRRRHAEGCVCSAGQVCGVMIGPPNAAGDIT